MSYKFESKTNDPQQFYWFKDGLTSEELAKFSNLITDLEYQEATILGESGSDGQTQKQVRSSKIKWIPHDKNWDWLYHRFQEMIVEANHELWGFELNDIIEEIQYTEYHASDKGHYDWHQDIGPGNASLRKISLTVQLTDSEEYSGGDLEIWQGGSNTDSTPRGSGIVIIFPSYMMHRVSPMTSGIRKSLVLWVGGEHYK
jgi:PKHD-type hydroxylase|tara:strand:- start:2361 stop:2960 length:600 start_codon:yes stop_codon:yes gene_type:complete